MPRIIGIEIAPRYKNLFLINWLSIFNFFPDKNITKAKTKVMSAIFDPNKVPKPKEGIPSSADVTEIKASGKMEITATIAKPTIYFGKLKTSTRLVEYLIAKFALLITTNKEISRITKDKNIIRKQKNKLYKIITYLD